MKNYSVVFALAASSFCVVAYAAPATNQTSNATATNDTISPNASLATYEELMAEGRAIRALMVGDWSQMRAFEAVNVFQKAVNAAPSLPLRAIAFVEGGEVLQSMGIAGSAGALDAFHNALRQTSATEWKGRALWGIANTEYFQASQGDNVRPGVLKLNVERLRANYDAAMKVRPLADAERRDVWSNFARLFEAEGKHLEAAREYSKIAAVIVETDYGKVGYSRDAIEQLKKATTFSPSQKKEAVALTENIFRSVMPVLKSGVTSWRLDQADLLAQFGEYARAEAILNEIANDTKVSEKTRADTIVKIAQGQATQKKYDHALLTLDRLPQLSVLYKTKHHLERAKVLLAQEKYDLATAEYFRVAIVGETEEKVDGFWGMADVAEKETAALRLKKAPSTAIAAKIEAQKRALTRASSQIGASNVTRRMSYEKLAQFEAAQGNVEEAKNWQDKANAAKSAHGK